MINITSIVVSTMKFITLLFVTYVAFYNAALTGAQIIIARDVNGFAQDGIIPPDVWDFVYSATETCNLDIATYLIRRMAPVGVDANVPPFDPFNASLISPIHALNCTIDLVEVVIQGLQQYDLHQRVFVSRLPWTPKAKLIYYDLKLPSVSATGNFRIKCPKQEIDWVEVRVTVINIISNGTLFLVLDMDRGNYYVGGLQMKDYFGIIELEFLGKKQQSDTSLGGITDILGDLMAMAIVLSVEKEFNELLDQFSSAQVDAYLDAENTRQLCGDI